MTIQEIRVYTVPLVAKTLYNMSNSTVTAPQSTVEIVDGDGVVQAAMTGHPEAKAALDIACWDLAG